LKIKEKYIKRCIELAGLGLGNTYPNPLVGSVIVHKGLIIGEGYHKKCGEPHAEVNAVSSVKNKELLKESTLYVNLEPCSHVGRTPACSTMIINNKIPKVVIGSIDSFDKVSGKGVEMLKNAGVDVSIGILENECRELNKRFFTFHEKKRPYIILKWAQTKDGFIDILKTNDSQKGEWITNEQSRTVVHKWRSEESAIMVGTDTAIKDNPKLDVRNWVGQNPLRISIDRNLKFNKNLNLLDKKINTIIYNSSLNKTEKNFELKKVDFNKDVIPQVLNDLYKREIQSIIIEGGEKLLTSFISCDLWDEARVFVGNKYFKQGINGPVFNLTNNKIMIGDSELYLIKNNFI
jgi:diaminohydroxyphosphoribosylaminopyrimidine deaminase/5-amino-6-(5-phosphoribosylamino)uracil reductase